MEKYNVIIVGASVAGSTLALLYSSKNLKIAIVDQKNTNDYKLLCTHFIQPAALSVLEKLNLSTEIESIGALKNSADYHFGDAWIYGNSINDPAIYGYNIERRLLDPLLKNKLIENTNITYFPSSKVTNLRKDQAEYTTVQIEHLSQTKYLQADLIVAADGRYSSISKIIENEEKKFINNRFTYFGYYSNVFLKSGQASQFWVDGRNMGFAYPLSDNITLLSAYIYKDQLEEWKEAPQEKIIQMFKRLPDGPDLSNATLQGTLHRMLDLTNISRLPVKDGVAFIGDAALALDPMSGVGCSFAFQSAEWLFNETIDALLDNSSEKLKESLDKYFEIHQKKLMPHAKGIMADSLANEETLASKDFFHEISNDAMLSESFIKLIYRLITPDEFQKCYLKRKLSLRKNLTAQKNV